MQAGETRVLASQTPMQWAGRFNLYRDSMNPVMTARFMRSGRMPHRSAQFKGLYFAGSSTHPGQWVSFCAISGVLAANCVLEDLGMGTDRR
jgi:phytoene dehydrogenase-like protein